MPRRRSLNAVGTNRSTLCCFQARKLGHHPLDHPEKVNLKGDGRSNPAAELGRIKGPINGSFTVNSNMAGWIIDFLRI